VTGGGAGSAPGFAGRVALVTGGTSGIGKAAALAFAKAGARVVIAARGVERGDAAAREIAEAGGEVRYVRADVSRAADVEALIAETVGTFGRLDAAVNNASTVDGVGVATADFTEEQFDLAIAGLLKSTWLCMRQEIRQMLAQDPPGGAIVNMSSINGLGGARGGALYAAAKAGVLALAKSAAMEYATQGIRVNAMAPGAFDTPMLRSAMRDIADRSGMPLGAVEAEYLRFIPQGRIGDPGEAVAAAVWLCSDQASYVTGLSLIVDGGWTAFCR